MVERRIERFQCVMPNPTPKDPQVQVFVQRLVDGEQLGSLVDYQIPLSKFFDPFEMISVDFVDNYVKDQASIPAADRVVSVDHNSSAYQEADSALEKLEEAIRGENGFAGDEEKERAQADVSAVRKLLELARARVRLIGALMVTGVGMVIVKFADKVIGEIASQAWRMVQELIGWLPKLPF